MRWWGSSIRYSPTRVMYGRGDALKLGMGAATKEEEKGTRKN
jgi:hypothetical protein